MSPDGRNPPPAALGTGRLDDASDDSLTWVQIRHFLNAPLRRPFLVLVPWAAVILASVLALFVVPKKYMSSTLILVESEKVPESFIAKVATRDRSQRLEAVKPEILSRTRLERVLQETRPYPDLDSKTRAVEELRKSIFINVSGNDGFTIEYHHRDPHKAQEVTDRLARLFIEETVKSREQQVEGAVDFLIAQVKDARTELENKDAALRRYKEEHMGRLPEQLQTNLATMQMLQREMQTVEESLFFAREKQDSLGREIGRSSGVAVSAAPSSSGPATDLVELRRQLASLRTRYTDEHPDVQSLRSRIARLEARASEAAAAGDQTGAEVSLEMSRRHLERTNQEVKKFEERQRDLERRISVIRANVEETPRTEQELSTLMRDTQKLNENYATLLSKQLEAQMSGRLEQRWKGEQFRMLDPASLPERPVFPKASVFVPLGIFFGLFVGLGAALIAEYLDPTVKDTQALFQAVQGYPVLACIPHHPGLGSALPRLVVVDRPVARRSAGDHAVGRSSSVPRSVVLRPDQVVFSGEQRATPSRSVAILDSLRDHNDMVGEELRLLAAKMLEACRRHEASCIALTSALAVEGKSTISIGLAGALAQDAGRRVLLIEADLRRPSLTRTLILPPSPGLSEWLQGTLDEVPIRMVEPAGFSLLSAGQMAFTRPELLRSPRMDALLRAARARYDFVLLDAVPVLPVSDAVLMQDLVDGFLLVVRSRQTPRDAIHDALGKLRADAVLGVVLNDHREYRGSYKYRDYLRYAQGGTSSSGQGPAARGSARLTSLPPADEHRGLEPAGSAASVPELSLHGRRGSTSRGRKVLAPAALVVLVFSCAAAGYVAGRQPVAPAAVEPVNTTPTPEATAALERVAQIENRLPSMPREQEAAAPPDVSKQPEPPAPTGRRVDPVALGRSRAEVERLAAEDQKSPALYVQPRPEVERKAADPRPPSPSPRHDEALDPPAATNAAVPAATPLPPRIGVDTPEIAAVVDLNDPDVIPPVLERAPQLAYPTLALRQRVQGVVRLNLLVDEEGNVADAQIVAGAGGRTGLNETAVDIVKGRRYRPATRDGVAVRVWLPVRIEFKLP